MAITMGKQIVFKPGQVLIKEGVIGNGFYILRSGHLEVYKDNVCIAEIKHPDTIFGEMSDILNKPRTCNIIAKTKSIVELIVNGIDDTVRNNPALTKHILRDLAERLEQTTKKLADSERNLLWTIKEPNKQNSKDNT